MLSLSVCHGSQYYRHVEKFQKDYVLASGEEGNATVFETFYVGELENLDFGPSYPVYKSGDFECQFSQKQLPVVNATFSVPDMEQDDLRL